MLMMFSLHKQTVEKPQNINQVSHMFIVHSPETVVQPVP